MPPVFKYYFPAVLLIAACSREPKAIQYGYDVCSHCKMTISDTRYGTEIITKKGKIYTFDSIECLINFVKSETVKQDNIHQLLITDFNSPDNFTEAENAVYLISENMPSPMGADLTGFKNRSEAVKFQSENGGNIFTWKEVISEIKDQN